MYKIEVVISDSETSKCKGNLLESFTEDFMGTQNYDVTRNIRLTASEIDLLCKNKINGKEIYVECKAYRDNLSVNILKQLLATVILHDYSEGWLISTGEFGQDSKGFIEKWKTKPRQDAERLSFYSPDKLITSFINANIVIQPERISLNEFGVSVENIGNWTLLISSFGTFWALECIEGGVPVGLLLFHAKTGKAVKDVELLNNLSKTDSSLKDLDHNYIRRSSKEISDSNVTSLSNSIVPVQQADSWDDYRPARPEDFVGRLDSQQKILSFFESVVKKTTSTRVFAITGNSGMGKSSLIAKLRSRCRNQHYRNKYFIYAVDVRAARDHYYIYNSIVKCLQEAILSGFIENSDVRITDYANPFSSDSIKDIISELKTNKRLICLVFDQFEELYSKPELFPIFEKAKNVFIDVSSLDENIVLGFAWKTDSTVYQDHPAYHFWHSLREQRYTISLSPFTKGDSEKVLSIFEKQINDKLPRDLRHQLVTNAQGYPWLLKKLCIHIYSKTQEELSIAEIINENLNIKTLFDKDLQELSQAERVCLRLVAQKAPVDWYEIAELTDSEILRSLIERRLVIRSGERLVIYWDIFKEYILTGKVPSLPFNYLPLSPSFGTFVNAINSLDVQMAKSYRELAADIGVSDGTAQNIVSDLFMLKVADGNYESILLKNEIDTKNNVEISRYLRTVFTSHIIVEELRKAKPDVIFTRDDIVQVLKKHNPTAQHNASTWRLYASRIGQWLSLLGYLTPKENYWINREQDLKDLSVNYKGNKPGSGQGFTLFNTSPKKVIEAAKKMIVESKDWKWLYANGYKNAYSILNRLRLIKNCGLNLKRSSDSTVDDIYFAHMIKKACKSENLFQEVARVIEDNQIQDPIVLSSVLNNNFNMGWSEGTIKRVGYSLMKWHLWLQTE